MRTSIGTIIFPLIAMITGLPLIGWAKPVPVNMRYLRSPKRDFAIVALAGPVSNLILAVAAACGLLDAAGGDRRGRGPGPAGDRLVVGVMVNVLLAVFNMMPMPPLDGGNVLTGILPDARPASSTGCGRTASCSSTLSC